MKIERGESQVLVPIFLASSLRADISKYVWVVQWGGVIKEKVLITVLSLMYSLLTLLLTPFKESYAL